MKEFDFSSQLAPMIERYLALRKDEGYLSKNQVYYLHELDLLSKATLDKPFVTKELVDKWDTAKPYLSNTTRIQRHNTIRKFAAFSYAQDGISYVPDTSKLRRNAIYSPHIFTHEEISCLIKAADNLPVRKNAPTRHLVVPAVIRLLYSSGLRINEALQLKMSDVDLDNGVISVKNGKGGKDRLVPIHSSAAEYLKVYSNQLSDNRKWFFPFSRGHYSRNAIYTSFRELLFICNIPHTGSGPRVHDFRHTFAVHSLEKQLSEGYDPIAILPRLAAYLGHKSYRETSWYIHLTISSFPDLTQKLDAAFSGIIPIAGGGLIEEN